MKTSRVDAFAVGLAAIVAAAAGLAIPGSAGADQALLRAVRTEYFRWGTDSGTPMPPSTGPDKAPPATGYVGDTTIGGKAAQYFTIPRGALRYNEVVSWSYFGTSSARVTELNGQGRFRPGNPHAATMTTTLRFPTTMSSVWPPLGEGAPRTPTTTFPYFRWNHYTSGGAPTPSATYRTRGNYDFKRAGSIRIWPGAHRFGGTLRWLYGEDSFWYRLSRNAHWLTRVFLPAMQWQREDTLTQVLGERASLGYGYRFRYTPLGEVHVTTPVYGATVHHKMQYMKTVMPWTTGKVRVYQPLGYVGGTTTLTFSGYDNRTIDGLMGTISMVRARLVHSYANPSDVSEPIRDFWHSGHVDRFDVIFAPEPGAVLLLVAGAGALVLLRRVNRRR